MIENNSKDKGQSDSFRQSLPNEGQTAQKSNPTLNPFYESSLLQGGLSPTIQLPTVASPAHQEAEIA